MNARVAAPLALFALLLAGCGGTDPDSSTSSTSTTTTTEPPASDLQRVNVGLHRFLRLEEAPTDRTVRVYQTAAQQAETLGLDGGGGLCAGSPGENRLSGQEIAWVGIYNRTGLAVYHEAPIFPVESAGRMDFTLQLPNDPPYLMWAGATCFGTATWDFHGSKWSRPPQSVGSAGNPPPDTFDEGPSGPKESITLRFPVGAQEADTTFTVRGRFYMTELQPITGDCEATEGRLLGDLYIYAPGPYDGGQWFIHDTWTLTDSTWESRHGETATPGVYRYHARLMAPAVVETEWRCDLHLYGFREPWLAQAGFQAPFRDYIQLSDA